MTQADGQFSGIFICYRRGDSSGYAGRLSDSLVAHFGDRRIFMDIGRIRPGDVFKEVISDAVGSCEVLIALIGQNWLTSEDEKGRRLDNPEDFVRLEIAAALARGVRVIPVLLQGAQMPGKQDLPPDLLPLLDRHAYELSDLRWKYDVEKLIGALEKIVAPAPAGTKIARANARVMLTALAVALLLAAAAGIYLSRGGLPTRNDNQVVAQPSPANAGQRPQFVKDNLGLEFVWIPSGSFMMGSENGDGNERPVHRVLINEGFYMGKCEVTQAQWLAVMKTNPSHFKDCGKCPVEQVSWDDAQEFIRRLNAENDGHSYRLPSEAEWEYAARAGTTGEYAGDLNALAWYENNSDNRTHPVGGKQSNVFGLFDTHGNVWEWVQDAYHDSYTGAPGDGGAWSSTGEQTRRVLRGGAWNFYAYGLRSATRHAEASDLHSIAIGFRVAATARQ